MAADNRRRQDGAEWAQRGIEAVRAGNFDFGRNCLLQAIKADKRNPFYRFDLALAQQGLGDVAAAIAELCSAIRLKSDFDDASRRLGSLLSRYQLADPAALDSFALRSAMQARNTDHQALAEAAIQRLAHSGPLAAALALLPERGAPDVARDLLVKRTGEPLRDELLLDALSHGVNKYLPLEYLLTALRRVLLLDVPSERFEDKALQTFALALLRQCLGNEHVWAETPEETERIAILLAGRPARKPDDFEVGRSVLLSALYRPLRVVFPEGHMDAAFASLWPRGLRDLLQEKLSAEAAEIALARRLISSNAGTDATGRKVAGQYEAAPYPRYTSLTLPRAGSLLPVLKSIFRPGPMPMLDGPLDVLIAGCGTGRHAIQSALGYGPAGKVTAIDISARSLSYASSMAQRFGVGNLAFDQVDIMTIDPRQHSYDIIETVGVLHHLADPFAGWEMLLACLRPHGLMMVGLYSKLSRQPLASLRAEPGYPGAGCSDVAARAYRQTLFARAPGQPGSDMALSKDAYTLSEFRDLALHEHERPVGLEEIANFLAKHKLAFHGFLLPGEAIADFRIRFPAPGADRQIADWAVYETENPRLFDGMYRFWCRRDP